MLSKSLTACAARNLFLTQKHSIAATLTPLLVFSSHCIVIMAETEAYVPPEDKGKGRCFRGAKCKHRNCKFSHPPPASKKVTAEDTTAHDPPVPSKEATNAIQEDMNSHKYAFETTTSKKMAPKRCKFGNHCTRKNCQYFHPAKQETSMTSFPSESTTTDGAVSKKKSSRDSDGLESTRPSEMAPPGRYDARNDTPELQDTVNQQTSKQESGGTKAKACQEETVLPWFQV